VRVRFKSSQEGRLVELFGLILNLRIVDDLVKESDLILKEHLKFNRICDLVECVFNELRKIASVLRNFSRKSR
jgi:hypothetical protein